MTDDFPLAAEFPRTTQAEWRKLVDAALKGAAFDKRLVTHTYDGLRVEPLYGRAAGVKPLAGRAPGTSWALMQRLDHPDPAAANVQALQDLENGAAGLCLVFAGAPAARGYGVVANDTATLDHTLSGVMLDLIPLRIETSPFAGRPVANLMMELVDARKLDPAKLTVDFGLDPIGDMARTGSALLPWPELSARAGATAKDVRGKGFDNAHLLRADGRAVHEAGGSEAQELAFSIAAGVSYLRLLEASGFALEQARQRISFLMAADADEFLTIAKFRALRKLWARVEQACGLKPQPAFVSAETAWRMMTRRDSYVNMLRATIAVTAAGVGGADAISVLPFTAALGLPDAFARRVARNTQLILLEESNLFRVSDPAAGSGGIEALTTQMSHAAWALLQEIEAAGGAAAALEQGLIQKKIAATRTEREAATARRKDAITGTSDYPNLGELPVAVLDVPRPAVPAAKAAITFEALPQIRLAEPFEALRDASDRTLAKTG
ncbi:MAG: methylmalonyl-CoA mutase subunit beta, partial [Pseudolabrys sp.]